MIIMPSPINKHSPSKSQLNTGSIPNVNTAFASGDKTSLSLDNLKAYFLNDVSFHGNLSSSTQIDKPGANCMIQAIHQTSFFRDPETLCFVRDYINETFQDSKKINIADFGCSIGEETYTLAMLLNDIKYNITGYDITQKVLDHAKDATYIIYENNPNSLDYLGGEDCFLLRDQKNLFSDHEKEFSKLFNQFFSEIKEPIEIKRKYEHFETPSIERLQRKKYFKLNPEKRFKCSIDYKLANITEIDKLVEPASQNVIFFKNAIYHLFPRSRSESPEYALASVDRLVKKVRESLSDNGIFVIGSLKTDHRIGLKEIKAYHGEKITNSPLHKILIDNNFEPVRFEKVTQEDEDGNKFSAYLPSVWKKVD